MEAENGDHSSYILPYREPPLNGRSVRVRFEVFVFQRIHLETTQERFTLGLGIASISWRYRPVRPAGGLQWRLKEVVD